MNDIKKDGVTVSMTPSDQVAKPATTETIVTDSLGRNIKLKKPSPLANLDFAKAAGGDKINLIYLGATAHLKFVAAIDDVPVACPSTEAELRALYARLGDEGNEAAQQGVSDHFMGGAARDAAEQELKNS